MMSSKIFVFLGCFLLSSTALAQPPLVIRITEENVKQFKSDLSKVAQPEKETFVETGGEETVTYVNRNGTRSLNPNKNEQDAAALGKSIEFEVYEINESRSSHTIFESGGGICYGFKNETGVDVTDATTYYIQPKKKEEYYTNIATANVNAQEAPKNMQYVPVFYIQDEALAEKVQAQEQKEGKSLAGKNIQKRANMLSKVICK